MDDTGEAKDNAWVHKAKIKRVGGKSNKGSTAAVVTAEDDDDIKKTDENDDVQCKVEGDNLTFRIG